MGNNFRILLEDTKQNLNKFEEYYIGREVIYDDSALDYKDLYSNYDEDDKAECEEIKAHSGKKATIISLAVAPQDYSYYMETNLEDKSAFDDCYWDIKFEDDFELSGISGIHLKLV